MARAVAQGYVAVILRTLVLVVYSKGNWRASGFAFKGTGEDFYGVILAALCGVTGLAGFPAVEVGLDVILV